MDQPILRLEKLTVRYGSFVAVDGLDLELRRGEVFGLLGPNGAGKSSTIRVLIGQRRPSAGRVTVAGLDVVRDWDEVKALFGYVPDRENHFEEFTGSAASWPRPRASRWWTRCRRPTRSTAAWTAPAPRASWTRPT